jgi:hypothetical protein
MTDRKTKIVKRLTDGLNKTSDSFTLYWKMKPGLRIQIRMNPLSIELMDPDLGAQIHVNF